jgi:putative spermidine/putrescine transport system permease protein
MKSSRLGPWLAIAIGAIYFLTPLIATFEFSLRMKRGEYSFEAYRIILGDPRFQASFGYSALIAVATIILGVALVVPTAYWIEYKLRSLRPLVEW